MRAAAAVLLLTVFAASASAARALEIYFIDVEGGQSTLLVTPAGESVLIDAGYGPRGARGAIPAVPNGRDAGRIMEAIRDAGLTRLDYLIVTHFHPDHVGGVPEVAMRIPIGTFVDYGMPLGSDRMTTGGFRNYEPVRMSGRHLVPKPGDRIPLKGLEAIVVSSGGELITRPLAGGGDTNSACTGLEDYPEDGTENYRSVGVMFRYGAFRFLDLGDLSGNTLTRLACPKNLLGHVSAYLVSHHGDYDTNVPALYAALRPRVAIMNNGVTRGGSPDQFVTINASTPLEDLWQLHFSQNRGADNAPDHLIANVDDGTFRVVNARNGFSKEYGRRPSTSERLRLTHQPLPTDLPASNSSR
jgi:beta-lactamase superfamily II metal-dependent hydrolase